MAEKALQSREEKVKNIVDLVNRHLPNSYELDLHPHKPWITVIQKGQRENLDAKLIVIYPQVDILAIHNQEAIDLAREIATSYRNEISESLEVKERYKKESHTDKESH